MYIIMYSFSKVSVAKDCELGLLSAVLFSSVVWVLFDVEAWLSFLNIWKLFVTGRICSQFLMWWQLSTFLTARML